MAALAIYAAAVATGSLAWQVYTWRRQHATRLKVTLERGLPPDREHTISDQTALITIVNPTGHDVRITDLALVAEDGRTYRPAKKWHVVGEQLERPLRPGTDSPSAIDLWLVPRGDRREVWSYLAEFETLVVYEPLLAQVETATGKTFRSPPARLVSREVPPIPPTRRATR